MSKNSNRVIEFTNEYWNKKSKDATLFELFSPNMIYKTIIGTRVGKQCYKSYAHDWLSAFPDYRIHIDQIEEIDNTVIVACECHGTYTNPFIDRETDTTNILETTHFTDQLQTRHPFGRKLHAKLSWVLQFQGNTVEKFISLYDKKIPYQQLGLTLPITSSQKQETSILVSRLNALLPQPLTPKEIECLALILCSFSAKHAAQLLKKSYRTIEAHLQAAYQKLGCFGKQHVLEMMYENHTLALWWDIGKYIIEQKYVVSTHTK